MMVYSADDWGESDVRRGFDGEHRINSLRESVEGARRNRNVLRCHDRLELGVDDRRVAERRWNLGDRHRFRRRRTGHCAHRPYLQ